jgi:hypothetical protein
MNRIPVALFPNRAQAEAVQQRLAQAGIAAELHEEVWLQKLWFVSKEAAGVHVEVAPDQFECAEALLASWDTPIGTLSGAIRCPECKSLLVDYPQFARNSIMTNIAGGLLAEVGLLEKDYYCEHCHYTWAKKHSAHSRSHLAPYYFIEGIQETTPLKTQQPS